MESGQLISGRGVSVCETEERDPRVGGEIQGSGVRSKGQR